jgi:hypothetical protein
MNNVYAFIVGIDHYDQPSWTISGPCANALAVTEWLLNLKVPPTNIFLFVDTCNKEIDDQIRKLEGSEVIVSRSARYEALDTLWRSHLQTLKQADSRLFVYWSGHGFVDKDGSRIFICRDYTHLQLKNRVFNCSNVFRHLRSPDYQNFRQQILLADVCAMKVNVDIVADKNPPENQVKDTKQIAFYASPELEYAVGNDGRGVFTQVALEVLQKFKGWPDFTAFRVAMETAFKQVHQAIFRVGIGENEADIRDLLVGAIPPAVRTDLFESVYSLLSRINVPDSVYRPHFLRTARDLGEPALASAQGLTGMIRELSSLRDADGREQVPYGLLQFLCRLHEELEFAAPIDDWLADHAALQGNMIANVRQKLADEASTKVLIIEVNNDEADKIQSYELSVRLYNLLPVPGIYYPTREVKNWGDFVAKLLLDLKDLAQRHSIEDFQIQFLVNPPLFNQEFHAILLRENHTLGEEYVVLVRHLDRVRSARRDIREPWIRYADALRSKRPSDLQLLPIPAGAADPKGVVPDKKGLCYTRFLVQSVGTTGSARSIEKDVLRRLLVNGVPYLYWLHALPEDDGFNKIGTQFTAWLEDVVSLDDFPSHFKEKRSAANDFARRATLLWDDPQFNPFDNLILRRRSEK